MDDKNNALIHEDSNIFPTGRDLKIWCQRLMQKMNDPIQDNTTYFFLLSLSLLSGFSLAYLIFDEYDIVWIPFSLATLVVSYYAPRELDRYARCIINGFLMGLAAAIVNYQTDLFAFRLSSYTSANDLRRDPFSSLIQSCSIEEDPSLALGICKP